MSNISGTPVYIVPEELSNLLARYYMPDDSRRTSFDGMGAEAQEIVCLRLTAFIDSLMLVGRKWEPTQQLGLPRRYMGRRISAGEDIIIGAFNVILSNVSQSSENDTTAMIAQLRINGVKSYSVDSSSLSLDNAVSGSTAQQMGIPTTLMNYFRNYIF